MDGIAGIEELLLLGGHSAARLTCDRALIPSPGRYVLAHELASAALLASALFPAEIRSGGFVAAPPIPSAWRPGNEVQMRGPLGRGFSLPAAARRVALVCIGVDPLRLLPLAHAALHRKAAVTLVCDEPTDQLPLQLEIQPVRGLEEVIAWSDYAAYDVEREALGDLLGRLAKLGGAAAKAASEVLVRVPMPCGGLADCGVCSIHTPRGFRLACVDGPVFQVGLLLGSG